jgi:hypothetical protein
MDDETVKAEIFQFIKENSGKFYELGLQVNFTKYPASYLRMILRQLDNEGKITNNEGYSPYRVVKIQ